MWTRWTCEVLKSNIKLEGMRSELTCCQKNKVENRLVVGQQNLRIKDKINQNIYNSKIQRFLSYSIFPQETEDAVWDNIISLFSDSHIYVNKDGLSTLMQKELANINFLTAAALWLF